MSLHLKIAPRANLDLAEIATYVAQDHPDVGLRFLQAASDTFHQLAGMPRLGAKLESANPRLRSYRVWPVRGFDNYLILYLLSTRTVTIARILHGARDIEALLEGS